MFIAPNLIIEMNNSEGKHLVQLQDAYLDTRFCIPLLLSTKDLYDSYDHLIPSWNKHHKSSTLRYTFSKKIVVR